METSSPPRQGLSIYYSEQGVVISTGEFSQGYKSGEWSKFYSDGSIASVGHYETGAQFGWNLGKYRVGQWYYYLGNGDAEEKRSGFYVKGKKTTN